MTLPLRTRTRTTSALQLALLQHHQMGVLVEALPSFSSYTCTPSLPTGHCFSFPLRHDTPLSTPKSQVWDAITVRPSSLEDFSMYTHSFAGSPCLLLPAAPLETKGAEEDIQWYVSEF
ncbi:unnamed protein product [Tilletia caries]|uniref:Uncharacterized protein n=2 Tax=Tilletia TaxID=13289 RepID=A0A8X7MTS5_9BASI|nr:hypothetical protein CF336_g6649 [Tilletia laevis]KAE8188297.1 hypothetical protein CF328_g6644 [Tilletia controversa]KAE8248606.1 hypothetical protein A4X03_0g6740 [Tilletia caries]KAE8191687.1 hypothetical protein CF335_g6023 [Tilletia laevis]KAE8248270.1 hypothetical protein A4X06_0g3830 [Tilletia controversa]